VIQLGHGARLALESLPNVLSLMHRAREHLHSDDAVEPDVFGPVNFTHAAGAQRSHDYIRAKSVTGG
jgi:hypothetical protein